MNKTHSPGLLIEEPKNLLPELSREFQDILDSIDRERTEKSDRLREETRKRILEGDSRVLAEEIRKRIIKENDRGLKKKIESILLEGNDELLVEKIRSILLEDL